MTHDDGGPPPGVARGTAHLRVFQPLAAFPDAVQARLIAGGHRTRAEVEAEAADGFNIWPAALPVGLEDFAAQVVPELQRRGMFRAEYASRTLRGNLGVPVPASRYGGAVVPAR